MPLRGADSKGRITLFDTSPEFHGTASASSPIEVLLESLASCSIIDVISILAKKRRQIDSLMASVEAERAESHPRVFTSISVHYELSSSDCPASDFEKAVELSMVKYCSVAAMLRNSGCRISWTSNVI